MFYKKSAMEKLNGKKILVVGATGGIGSSLVKLLHQSGASLFISGRNTEKLLALSQQIGLSSSCMAAVDITSSTEVEQLAVQVNAEMGTLDILINASGIGIIKPLEHLSLDDFMQSLQTNLVGSFLLVKAFLPAMKEVKKGLIINIPGVLGKVPMAGAAAYSASKYGIVGMMQSIREELKRTEIRITNIFLGGVDSPFWETIDLKVQKEKMIREEEAARAIWFLCQQPASGVVSEMVLQPFNHQAI
ncbi:MAG: oxidoreductase [Chitinophagaceae bacterium]|nr:MAG: oxidoreductase [Chitinophagaceae bacterium]